MQSQPVLTATEIDRNVPAESVWKLGERAISGVIDPLPRCRSSILDRSERSTFRGPARNPSFHTASAGTLRRVGAPRCAGVCPEARAGRPRSPIRATRERCRCASAQRPLPATIVASYARPNGLFGDSPIAVASNLSQAHPGNQLRCQPCLTQHWNGPGQRPLGASLVSAGGPAVQLRR